MASNNTTKDETLLLFPDNNNFEINASDIRSYVESIFGDKEVEIIKIDSIINLAANNTNIYEGSIVVFWNDTDINRIGIYLSKINQPTLLTDLIQVSSITGEDIASTIQYTYDYTRVENLFDISNVYQEVISLTTPNRAEGTYELGIHITYNFDQNNKLLLMQTTSNLDTPNEFAAAPADNIYNNPRTIVNTIDWVGGEYNFKVEMRKEDTNGIFNIISIVAFFKRVS